MMLFHWLVKDTHSQLMPFVYYRIIYIVFGRYLRVIRIILTVGKKLSEHFPINIYGIPDVKWKEMCPTKKGERLLFGSVDFGNI